MVDEELQLFLLQPYVRWRISYLFYLNSQQRQNCMLCCTRDHENKLKGQCRAQCPTKREQHIETCQTKTRATHTNVSDKTRATYNRMSDSRVVTSVTLLPLVTCHLT